METSKREVPRSNFDSPPDFSELTLEACLNYCPPILYNMVASICGLTNDIIDEPQTQRVKLSVEDQNRVAAICQDVVYLKHKGTVIPPKTLALGITLRHLTADSRVNRLVANLGHAASYNVYDYTEIGNCPSHASAYFDHTCRVHSRCKGVCCMGQH